MGELQTVLDALDAADLHGLAAADQLSQTAELIQARNRIDALIARRARHAECAQAPEHDGLKSMASWLRGHARLSARASGLVVRNGRALEHLPKVAAACAAGLITADQLAVIAPITTPANLAAAAEQGVDLAEIDRLLTDVATTRQHTDLVTVVHRYLACLDPDGPEPDPTEQRSLTLVKHADGSISGRFDLDPVGGEKLQSVLESFVQKGRTRGDTRTRTQQQADALVQWADVTLAAGQAPKLRTHKPHVVVTVNADPTTDDPTTADPTTAESADAEPACSHAASTTAPAPADGGDLGISLGIARTGFGTLLSTAQTRLVACDGLLTRVMLDADGVPIHHGRSKRVSSPQLRRVVVIRDEHCVFAGCLAPQHWCDVHHLVHWLDGGETCPENSGLLCERHHTQVHHGFRIERQPDGRWRTYRPDGTEILVPAPLAAA